MFRSGYVNGSTVFRNLRKDSLIAPQVRLFSFSFYCLWDILFFSSFVIVSNFETQQCSRDVLIH